VSTLYYATRQGSLNASAFAAQAVAAFGLAGRDDVYRHGQFNFAPVLPAAVPL
jgi:hypothetical protein